ncbi:MAG: acyl-CoA thioesterase [Thermoguttaceae bacterium]|nr:acyl-CoA thioesterase [Thermoguttaceae bacterium]
MNGFVDEGLVFHLDIPVLDSDADVFEHANNTRYIHWMQSIAIAHSEFYGWDDKRYIEYGGGWFVRRHVVDYIHPVFPGEVLHGETWVEEMKNVSCLRKYRFTRKSDGLLISNAETRWAFVNFATGRPMRIPEKISSIFVPRAADDRR